MNYTLSVSHLSKTYQKSGIEVLRNISFSVKKGEFVSIIGPSGCGKTTLLSILAGVEQQTNGEIQINGKIQNKREGKFGYMPQQATLLPWRTVLENVALGLEVCGISKKEREEKANKLLVHFNLDQFSKFYPKTLSGGMASRVALLRTILFHRDFLLLDEPFGALDALTRISCQTWLKSIWKEYNATILFVTHDIREAIFLSNRILVMSKRPGEIIKEVLVTSSNKEKLEKEILQYIKL